MPKLESTDDEYSFSITLSLEDFISFHTEEISSRSLGAGAKLRLEHNKVRALPTPKRCPKWEDAVATLASEQ